MSREPAPDAVQPTSFAFTDDNLARVKAFVGRYPEGRQASAVLPALELAQRQHDNWLPRAAMDAVADLLGMAHIRVYEVATFYEMFNLSPIGQHHVRVCTTTPCQLRGAMEVLARLEGHLDIGLGETSADGQITLGEFECLGACVNAPVVWIDDDYYEDVDADKAVEIIDALRRGERPTPGPQVDRHASAPISGAKTLLDVAD